MAKLTSEMTKLKPCPFCGGEAKIDKWYAGFGRRMSVTVQCTKCRGNSGAWHRTDKAVEHWNRRTSG